MAIHVSFNFDPFEHCFAYAESGIKIGDWLKLMEDPKKSKEARAIFIGHSIGVYAIGQQMVYGARGRFDVLQIDQFFFAHYISTLKFSGWCYRQIYTIEETLENFHQYAKSRKVNPHQDFGQLFNTFFMFEDETIAKENKDNQCMYLLLREAKKPRDMPLRMIKD